MIETPLVERYADGEAIITEGIVSTRAYVLLSGEAKVVKKGGEKNVVIGTLKQGDIFGEMGLIGNTFRTASVIAIGNVNLGIIEKEHFDKLLLEIPEEMQLVTRALIERLKMTTGKLAQLAIQFNSVKNSMNALSTKTMEK